MTEQRRLNSCDGDAGCRYAKEISRESADVAVKKVFAILGVDITKPESVEEFREDLRFGGKLRQISEKGMLAFTGVVFTALAYAMVEVIKGRL